MISMCVRTCDEKTLGLRHMTEARRARGFMPLIPTANEECSSDRPSTQLPEDRRKSGSHLFQKVECLRKGTHDTFVSCDAQNACPERKVAYLEAPSMLKLVRMDEE
jgi:hypothetical protein